MGESRRKAVGNWPCGQEKGQMGRGPWAWGCFRRGAQIPPNWSRAGASTCPHVWVSSGSSRAPQPHLPCSAPPTSVTPVAECPWPPGLPPTSYSTRLRATQFWDPRIIPSFPFPAPAPLGPGAQPPLARPPPRSFLLPSHPPPTEALGREEASPQSGKEATGAASKRERRAAYVPIRDRFTCFHTAKHSHIHIWTH